MSKIKTHPVYYVDSEGGSCGHMHQTEEVAWNCAGNLCRQHRMHAFFEVVKVKSDKTDARTSVIVGKVSRVHEPCTECGSILHSNADYEFGHDFQCPLVTG